MVPTHETYNSRPLQVMKIIYFQDTSQGEHTKSGKDPFLVQPATKSYHVVSCQIIVMSSFPCNEYLHNKLVALIVICLVFCKASSSGSHSFE